MQVLGDAGHRFHLDGGIRRRLRRDRVLPSRHARDLQSCRRVEH